MDSKEKSKQPPLSEHDKLVGKVAGEICLWLLSHSKLKDHCLILTPAVTYKVKKYLAPVTLEKKLSTSEKKELSNKICSGLTPVLKSYDIKPEVISEIKPNIEQAVYNSLG